MLANDFDVQKLLTQYYPEKKIYADEYQMIHKKLGIAAYNELRIYCRNQGYKSAKEWLIQKGWYVNIERDMREKPLVLNEQLPLERIVEQVFESCALLGNMVLAPQHESLLMEQAQHVFDQFLQGQYWVTDFERDALTLSLPLYLSGGRGKKADHAGCVWKTHVDDQSGGSAAGGTGN